jgi:CheY-like chemotaxis protein/anti-sigma regulatory factor (Ser/Thr protein kinase)
VDVSAEQQAEPESERIRILLFECVRELLFNAVKHCGDDCARVELSRAGQGDIELLVADSGMGFDASSLEHSDPESTTFGLFNVRERLTYIGGEMEIDSAPGKGTRITLTAPATEHEEAPAEHNADEPGAADEINVLVADDHNTVRRMLVAQINETDGMRVVADVADGREAVDRARKLRPDVLVIDISMPGMDGPEAAARLQESCPEVRIIGHTAHSGAEPAEAMQAGGAFACVRKESSCEQLLTAIRDAARSHDGRESAPGEAEAPRRRRGPGPVPRAE